MDIAYKVAQYLANAGYGVIGDSIFVGQLPETTVGLSIERAGGQLNNYVPIEETVLDIYAKNTSAEAAMTLLENIKRYLHRMNNTPISDAYVYTFLVINDITPIQRDMEYAKIYKITVQVVHRDTGLIS